MKAFVGIVLLCLVAACGSQAPKENVYATVQGVAIQGYDPVSYLAQNQAQKGQAQHVAQHNGFTWQFANAQNLALFKANPEKYVPAYGGWCAYAMAADGAKVEVDPETYKVINGQTYLFYHTALINTLDKWNENEAALLSQANENWQNMAQK